MTCITGLEHEGVVYMGADSASVRGHQTDATRMKKVFVKGPFLIGFTHSFRMGQLLEYGLNVREQQINETDLQFMVTAFVEAVRTCLKQGGFARNDSGEETGGQFLVGYRGTLYYVHSDYQVNSHEDGYGSVGCGAEFALGALFASRDCNVKEGSLIISATPEIRVLLALQAAAHFSGSVCRPFLIEKQKREIVPAPNSLSIPGVVLTPVQQQKIHTLYDAGKLVEAQQEILALLNDAFEMKVEANDENEPGR